MRRGLLKELADVFEEAIAMLGGGNPNLILSETARYKALHKEVVGLLTNAPYNVTAGDRALARELMAGLNILDEGDEGRVAKVLAALHDSAVSCAVVRAEREREKAEEDRREETQKEREKGRARK